MSWKVGYWADLSGIELSDKNVSWVHAARPGEYVHPTYGKLDFNFERLRRFADGVKSKVRGIDLDIDYDHKSDPAKGAIAAGWVRDAEVRNDGLYLSVEWTEAAAKAIKDKEYRYFSPEFTEEWISPDGTKHTDVVFGGGLTNRPFLKDLLPVNLSELTFKDPVIVPEPEGEKEVDLKALAKILGLSEDSDEATVMLKLTERLATPPPAPNPPAPVIQLTDAIRNAAKDNPLMAQMIQLYEFQAKQNADNQKLLREQSVATKLTEFDSDQIKLSPVARQLMTELGLAMPQELSEKFWSLLHQMNTNSHMLVKLGETAGTAIQYREDKGATATLNERVAVLTKDGKMSAADAYDKVLAEDPGLYAQYRKETYITSQGV